MKCRICKNQVIYIFNALVINKYDVKYYQCVNCRFIQTESPYWLKEAYQSAITKLDIGLINRNIEFSNVFESIFISGIFNPDGRFLDFGGGYGMFVRLMRDKGFDYYRYDIYCQNLFAEFFDYSDLATHQKFDALTAFEVFEHLENPQDGVSEMLSFSDILIFSTELQPTGKLNPDTWWYFVPETGQHVSFYSIESLEEIAKINALYLYSNNRNLHILSKTKLKLNPFKLEVKRNYINILIKTIDKYFNQNERSRRKSLLMADFEYIKNNLLG